MSRIKSSSIQLGESFIIGASPNNLSSNKSHDGNSKNKGAKADSLELLEAQIAHYMSELKFLEAEVNNKKEAATQEAAKIIGEAQNKADALSQKADKIIEKAQKSAEKLTEEIKAQAWEEGYKVGMQQGTEQITKDMQDQIKSFGAVAATSIELKKQIIKSAEKDIIDLVILMAQQLTKTKIEIEPVIISNILMAAMSELKEKEEVKIFANPSVTDYLKETIATIRKSDKSIEVLKVIKDKTVSPDGVIVETPQTRVDARLQVQVAELAKNLLTEYSSTPIIEDIKDIEKIENKVKEKKSKKMKKSEQDD